MRVDYTGEELKAQAETDRPFLENPVFQAALKSALDEAVDEAVKRGILVARNEDNQTMEDKMSKSVYHKIMGYGSATQPFFITQQDVEGQCESWRSQLPVPQYEEEWAIAGLEQYHNELPQFVIVFDNGGGVQLKLGDDWAHFYIDPTEAAEDLVAYLASGSTDGWEGHEEQMLAVQKHESNIVFDEIQEIHGVDTENAPRNVADFVEHFWKLK